MVSPEPKKKKNPRRYWTCINIMGAERVNRYFLNCQRWNNPQFTKEFSGMQKRRWDLALCAMVCPLFVRSFMSICNVSNESPWRRMSSM